MSNSVHLSLTAMAREDSVSNSVHLSLTAMAREDSVSSTVRNVERMNFLRLVKKQCLVVKAPFFF